MFLTLKLRKPNLTMLKYAEIYLKQGYFNAMWRQNRTVKNFQILPGNRPTPVLCLGTISNVCNNVVIRGGIP